MTYTLKMLIPLGLGIVAGLLNYASLNADLHAVRFVRATRDVALGERFDEQSFEPFELPARFVRSQDFARTAIPWEDRGRLIDRAALRQITAGDLVFWGDLQEHRCKPQLADGEELRIVDTKEVAIVPRLFQVGDTVKLEYLVSGETPAGVAGETVWVGPFRLAVVGSMFQYDPEWSTQSGEVEQVGVAISSAATGEAAQATKRLEAMLVAQRQGLARLVQIVPASFHE